MVVVGLVVVSQDLLSWNQWELHDMAPFGSRWFQLQLVDLVGVPCLVKPIYMRGAPNHTLEIPIWHLHPPLQLYSCIIILNTLNIECYTFSIPLTISVDFRRPTANPPSDVAHTF